jgi:ketosteroid isomerase-like protein
MTDLDLTTSSRAESVFYAAFEAADLGTMAAVWAPGDKTRCAHPGGDLIHGYDAVLQSWRSILASAEAPTVRFRVIDRLETDDLAVHVVEEYIAPAGDASRPTRVLATNIYLRTGEGWRIVIHHATLPIVEKKEAPPAAGRLH